MDFVKAISPTYVHEKHVRECLIVGQSHALMYVESHPGVGEERVVEGIEIKKRLDLHDGGTLPCEEKHEVLAAVRRDDDVSVVYSLQLLAQRMIPGCCCRHVKSIKS